MKDEDIDKADSKLINNIFGHARQYVAEQKAFLNRIAYLAVKEYKSAGLKLPKDNIEAYDEAVGKIYAVFI